MKNCRIYETMNPVTEMKVKEEGGFMTLSGTFGVCGIRNRNHRVYEKSNYAKCVTEMQQRIKENGGIPGELEHPETMNITLENVSHKITSIKIDEDGVVSGEIQLLNTPKGKIAQAIVEGGLPLFVSSRAMGKVDKNGNVTLENISSFDLVGTPGFAEARMHLNESQSYMDYDDDHICVIAEGEEIVDANPINENTNNEDMNQELLDKLEMLESRIESLESENETLKEQLEDAQDKQIDLQKLAEGIQSWIINEYSPVIENWLKEEFAEHMINENKKVFVQEIAPKIQKWIIEDYSPEIQKWIIKEYSLEVENWFMKSVAPGIQGWMIDHFAPEIENWVDESYSARVKDMIEESFISNKESKLKSISETLALLENIDVKKPVYGGHVINENQENEPYYVMNMPEQYRPQYNMASNEVKESIARRAKLYDFNNEGALERFWENVNFDEIKPATSVYEGLDRIEDERERAIRAQFRRKRIQ